jgi:hypothetical protein
MVYNALKITKQIISERMHRTCIKKENKHENTCGKQYNFDFREMG